MPIVVPPMPATHTDFDDDGVPSGVSTIDLEAWGSTGWSKAQQLYLALEKTECKCRWSYDHASSVLVKCPRCAALNQEAS